MVLLSILLSSGGHVFHMINGEWYMSKKDYDVAVLEVFLVCAVFWFFVFAGLTAWWRAKYFSQKSEIPEEIINDVTKDARAIQGFIEERIDISSKAPWTHSQAYIAKHKDFVKSWFQDDQLEAVVWLLYSIGIGIKLFLVERDEVPDPVPPKRIKQVRKWKYKRNELHLHSILLFLSSVSLMALAVFVFLS